MKKIKTIAEAITNPFDRTVYKTERAAVALLMHWMREIIETENIDLGLPDVETISSDKKLPDIVIYENRRSNQVLCLIEAKPPHYDVFNEKELIEPARKKATQRKSKYFATTNFKKLIWFNTEKVNALKPEEEQIVDKFNLSEIELLDYIESHKISQQIKSQIKEFLLELFKVHSGIIPEPKLPLDELLIFRIQEKIRVLSNYYQNVIEDKVHKDSDFLSKLQKWFYEQGWSFTWDVMDYIRVARQAAYLIINKILFYDLLQAKRPSQLDPLNIYEGITKGSLLKNILQAYFNQVTKNIDYETIYTTDFIDEVAFPESSEVVEELKSFTKILKKYDFSNLGFDIIGRIFERMIPDEERHILGQYFTNTDVIDLILRFCHKHEDDKILDPSCGAGTFLVRAYQNIRLMNKLKTHSEILENIWGNDIAKFPAHLATINLAINDLSQDKNYPNILQADFFSLQVGANGFEAENWRKGRAQTLGKYELEITYPRYFDAIVGNPPYTRQEEIPETGVDKEKLIESALQSGDEELANISKRAGLHAYFFIHGTKFLKDDGYFGFVVSSLWLDSDYGKGLQEFFLENYKIIALIESKVERWFEDADVPTCIVILQKCKEEKLRNQHKVRFVYLKRKLNQLFPTIDKDWTRQVLRAERIDSFIETILSHNKRYENNDLIINVRTQKELFDEGYDKKSKTYIGANWAKYIRAPEILFEILKKNKKNLKPLSDFAKVRFGIKSGVNEFFYLTDEQISLLKIEKEFLQPIIFTLKEIEKYYVEPEKLKRKAIICWKEKKNLKNKHILRYIQRGEENGYQNRPTCKSRKPWYALGKNWEYAPLIFPAKVGERMPILKNNDVYEDKKFYGIFPKRKRDINLIGALLNSTVTRLFVEFSARQLTGGQAIADIDVRIVEETLIPDIDKIPKDIRKRILSAYKKLLKEDALSIFDEIAPHPDLVDLEKVLPARRKLDDIIMKEILGLSIEQQKEVYFAVVDLVRSRLTRAETFYQNNDNNDINLSMVKDSVLGIIKNHSK